jgi:hypothetical protein
VVKAFLTRQKEERPFLKTNLGFGTVKRPILEDKLQAVLQKNNQSVRLTSSLKHCEVYNCSHTAQLINISFATRLRIYGGVYAIADVKGT